MKKNKFYLLAIMFFAVSCIGFVSCDDDDEAAGDIPSELVGTWKYVKKELYAEGELYRTYGVEGELPYWQFKANGSGAEYDLYEGEWDREYFTYKVENNILTFSHNYSNRNYRIETLTSTTLVVKEGSLDGIYSDSYFELTYYTKVSDSEVK